MNLAGSTPEWGRLPSWASHRTEMMAVQTLTCAIQEQWSGGAPATRVLATMSGLDSAAVILAVRERSSTDPDLHHGLISLLKRFSESKNWRGMLDLRTVIAMSFITVTIGSHMVINEEEEPQSLPHQAVPLHLAASPNIEFGISLHQTSLSEHNEHLVHACQLCVILSVRVCCVFICASVAFVRACLFTCSHTCNYYLSTVSLSSESFSTDYVKYRV